MAKRKTSGAPTRSSVRLSVSVDVLTHAKLHAYAALRGTTISAVLADAASELVRSMVVMDRRRPPVAGDLPVRSEDRTPGLANLDDPGDEESRPAA